VLIDVAEWRQDILEEHLSELEPLWRRRISTAKAATADAVALKRCDARIDANTDALALADDCAWPLLENALGAGDPALAAAATMVVATSGNPQAEAAVLDAFRDASDEVRAAMRLALTLRASPGLLGALDILARSSSPAAASAWAICALRTGLGQDLRERWMLHASAEARQLMWHVEARLAGRTPSNQRNRQRERFEYERALDDPDREVRRSAVEAAARTGQRWLLERLRGAAAQPSPKGIDELVMLAVLAGPAEQSLVAKVGRCRELGWSRFNVLALAGTAAAVEVLLEVMQQGPAVDAALAAQAFHRITGITAQGTERVPLLPDGAEPDESADEILACDVERARQGWQAVKGVMAQRRFHYGVDAATLATSGLPLTFDLETRWCLQVRAAHEHPDANVVFDAEVFPFR
jgi:hypothetical protein